MTKCGLRFCPPEVALKVAVVWDVTTCSMIEMCGNFGGNCCLQFQDRRCLLKMVVGSSEMSMNVYLTRGCYIPDGRRLAI